MALGRAPIGAEIRTVAREPGQTWTEAVLAALDETVAIVSVPNVHWTDGALIDLPPIARRTRQVGARLVIDGSQSVGAMPIDVEELRPDFLVTVGYKWLLGPFSVGYLYVAEEHRHGEPLEENWILRAGSEDFARLVDYRDEYQPGARRFDVGQRTKFELLPMAIAALEQIVDWRVSCVAGTLAERTSAIARGAAGLGLDAIPDEQRGPHMLGVRLPDRVLAGSDSRTDQRQLLRGRTWHGAADFAPPAHHRRRRPAPHRRTDTRRPPRRQLTRQPRLPRYVVTAGTAGPSMRGWRVDFCFARSTHW